MIEPKMYSYSDFPANTASTDGMKGIKAETEELNIKWIRDVEYIDRGGKNFIFKFWYQEKLLMKDFCLI